MIDIDLRMQNHVGLYARIGHECRIGIDDATGTDGGRGRDPGQRMNHGREAITDRGEPDGDLGLAPVVAIGHHDLAGRGRKLTGQVVDNAADRHAIDRPADIDVRFEVGDAHDAVASRAGDDVDDVARLRTRSDDKKGREAGRLRGLRLAAPAGLMRRCHSVPSRRKA